MRMRNLQSINAMQIDSMQYGRSAVICTLLVASGMAYGSSDTTRVAPQQQQARDNDRLRILNDELARVRDAIEDLAKRRAERIAAADSKGVETLDVQRDRALADKAGLEREIAAASKAPPIPIAAPEGATPSAANRRPPINTPLPWWDVYSKVPLTSSASKGTSATP